MEKMNENHKKKLFLSKYLEYVQCEETILQKIQELRLDKSCPSVINDGMPHGTDKSDLSGFAVQIDEKMGELKAVREKEYIARRDVLARIRGLDDKDEQILLRLKYIKDFSVGDAATMLGVGRTKGYDIHNSAIKNLKL